MFAVRGPSALKQAIQHASDILQPVRVDGFEHKCFWSLMACFCARWLLDCAECADAESFHGFVTQVLSKTHAQLAHTRRDLWCEVSEM